MTIATSHSIYQIALSTCRVYSTKEECLSSYDPHCGWHLEAGVCSDRLDLLKNHYTSGTVIPAVDRIKARYNVQCPTRSLARPERDYGWSPWRTCNLTFLNQAEDASIAPYGSCKCRICLDDTLCSFGEQQVSHCIGKYISTLQRRLKRNFLAKN